MMIESWTVTPLYRPDLDDDPMGVFVVEPAATLLTARYFAAEAETPELDAIHADNAAIGRLLQATPKLLEALQHLAEQVDQDCPAEYRSCHLSQALEQAIEVIAEATGRAS